MGKSSINGPFSMAMLNNQRVLFSWVAKCIAPRLQKLWTASACFERLASFSDIFIRDYDLVVVQESLKKLLLSPNKDQWWPNLDASSP